MQVLADEVSLQVQAKFGKFSQKKTQQNKNGENFNAFCPEFQNDWTMPIISAFFLIIFMASHFFPTAIIGGIIADRRAKPLSLHPTAI